MSRPLNHTFNCYRLIHTSNVNKIPQGLVVTLVWRRKKKHSNFHFITYPDYVDKCFINTENNL